MHFSLSENYLEGFDRPFDPEHHSRTGLEITLFYLVQKRLEVFCEGCGLTSGER